MSVGLGAPMQGGAVDCVQGFRERRGAGSIWDLGGGAIWQPFV